MVASRYSTEMFNPVIFNGLRLTLASIGFALVYLFRIGQRGWPKGRKLWQHSALIGIIGTAIPMTAVVSSFRFQSSGFTSLLLTVTPAITVIMAHFFLIGERLTSYKWIGIALALGGALMLILRGENGLTGMNQAVPVGYILVFIAVICISLTTIYTRKYMQDFNALDVAGIRIFISAIVMMPFSVLIFRNNLTQIGILGWASLGYATIFGTFLGFMVEFSNIKRFGATSAVMVSYLIPIITSFSGAVLLGEQITMVMFIGMGLIFAGIKLINASTGVRSHNFVP
jgi:drug/metabolite transporter (DMT)-like permease